MNQSISPSILAVVVTYNSAAEIAQCLSAIQSSESVANLTAIVVYICSRDQTLSIVNEFQILAIASSHNRGYASAIHCVARRISKYDYVLIMNPDVTLRPDTLGRMLSAFERNPAIGAV